MFNKINFLKFKKEIKRSEKPVLLCFWADDGVSSFMFRETVNSLNDRIKIFTGNKKLRKKYKINFLPTSLVIKNNQVTDRIIGNVGKENFEKILFK